jgi:hypothetical protein
MVTTEDGKDCEYPTCDAREKIVFDGTCEACPDYQRTFDDKFTCEMPTCSEREKVLKIGTCEKCGAYEKASAD